MVYTLFVFIIWSLDFSGHEDDIPDGKILQTSVHWRIQWGRELKGSTLKICRVVAFPLSNIE